MKNNETPNPWQVLNAVSQRISQGFGVRSDTPSRTRSESGFSLEETSRRTVAEHLAGADIKPISGWLRHPEGLQLAKPERSDRMPSRPNTPP
jgi:hypothetical protein